MHRLVPAILCLALASSLYGDAAECQKRARSLLSRQDYQGALKEAAIANTERPDDIAGYQLVAAAQMGLGNYDEAEKALQWMLDLRIGKTDPEGWLLLSRFREAIGDLEGALDAVNSGFGRLTHGQLEESRIFLISASRLLRLSGKLTLAEQVLRQLNSDGADNLEELGLLRLAQDRKDEGIDLLRRAVKMNAEPRLLYRIALATSDESDIAAFDRAARDRMDDTKNANRELVLYLANRKPEEALTIAQKEEERRHDIGTMDALAVALYASGQKEEARSVMKKVLAIGTRDPEVLAHAGQIGVRPE